jgi:hypothetical protein
LCNGKNSYSLLVLVLVEHPNVLYLVARILRQNVYHKCVDSELNEKIYEVEGVTEIAYLLLEDGGFLFQQNSDKIIL